MVEVEDSLYRSEDGVHGPSLDWNGDSRSELTAVVQVARSHANHADVGRAENLFLVFLRGTAFYWVRHVDA